MTRLIQAVDILSIIAIVICCIWIFLILLSVVHYELTKDGSIEKWKLASRGLQPSYPFYKPGIPLILAIVWLVTK